MKNRRVNITGASPSDLDDLLGLLTSVNLPHEGVREHLGGFLVARDRRERLIGTVGLERHGSVGLLRAAVLAPGLQGSGLGACLTSALLERAMQEGVEKVVLMTSTARDFFARRRGIAHASCANYDGRLRSSPERRSPRHSLSA